MDGSRPDPIHYAFGPFRLDPARRVLTREGRVVELSPRLVDLLLALLRHAVQNPGEPMPRDALLLAVWGGRVVEDGNLKQGIFALRRALAAEGADPRLLLTLPGRGYLIIPPVRCEPPALPLAPAEAAPRRVSRRLLAACLVPLALVSLWLLWPVRHPAVSGSIAVRPFSAPGQSPQEAAFADGVAEEIAAALCRLGALRVASPASSFAPRLAKASPAEAGRQLGVATLLEGSVRRLDSRLRITVALVGASDGFARWAQSFDIDPSRRIETETAIATAAAAALGIPPGQTEAVQGGTRDPQAFDAYLQAAHLADSGGPGENRQALPLFDAAIAHDPGFAMALARRSQAALLVGNSGARSTAESRALIAAALADAERAIAAAPALGFAHLARGAALMSVQRLRDADAEMSRAYALSPGDSRVAMDYALTQVQYGRVPAGLAAARAAAARDPLSPGVYLDLASVLLAAHRAEEASAEASRAGFLGDEAGAAALHHVIDLEEERFAQVLPLCEKANDWPDLLCQAIAAHALGRREEAAGALGRLHAAIGETGALQYAEVAAQWGEEAEAVRWLEEAYRLHDTGLVLIKSDRLLDPIRGLPGYREIEARLGFPS